MIIQLQLCGSGLAVGVPYGAPMRLRQVTPTIIVALAMAGAAQAQIPNFTPPTPLLGAIMHDDTAEVKRLLAAGADPNEGRMIGFPPVFMALIHQNKEAFRALVAKGANIRETDPSGSTLLM